MARTVDDSSDRLLSAAFHMLIPGFQALIGELYTALGHIQPARPGTLAEAAKHLSKALADPLSSQELLISAALSAVAPKLDFIDRSGGQHSPHHKIKHPDKAVLAAQEGLRRVIFAAGELREGIRISPEALGAARTTYNTMKDIIDSTGMYTCMNLPAYTIESTLGPASPEKATPGDASIGPSSKSPPLRLSPPRARSPPLVTLVESPTERPRYNLIPPEIADALRWDPRYGPGGIGGDPRLRAALRRGRYDM
jgi:hypothetical protein